MGAGAGRWDSRSWSGARNALIAVSLGSVVIAACQQPLAPPVRVEAAGPAPVRPAISAAPAPVTDTPSPDDTDPTEPLWVRASWRQLPSIGCGVKHVPPLGVIPPDGGAPRLPQGGSLDKESIRRIMRRHINGIRACYNAALVSNPSARGRVMTRLAITALGTVKHTCLVSTTLDQPQAERCIVDEILNWEFPKPLGDGWVVVDYPFVLTPTAEASAPE